jgi:hypothetical protein
MQKKTPSPDTPHRIIEDSILTGIIDAFHECQITPEQSESGRTHYRIEGDVDAVLQRIYRNEPVGSLDALKAIKAARQAIFSFRLGKGNGEGYETHGKGSKNR